MITANEIKEIRLLQTKKGREESGLFIVEGDKLVREALESDFEVVRVLRESEIGEKAMSRISALVSPSPSLAVVRQKNLRSEDRELPSGLYLALDGIRDPGNLGTIIRIADWFGMDGILASGDTVELYNPKTVQATMGAIFRVPVIYTDIPAACKAVALGGGQVFGTFLDERSENLYRADLNLSPDKPSVIVIGNEANGISEATAQAVTRRIYIPPFPEDERTSESLNAAVATAVTVSEFRRRMMLR
ncbi:MAG: RNA methyltransferase [Bacteroidales bacterium]|nr:RNA methyltransferase [Bacteroidales bacterium]